MALTPKLQDLLEDGSLVDPKTLEPLRASGGDRLEAPGSGRSFPIEDGIPRLIEAEVKVARAPGGPDKGGA